VHICFPDAPYNPTSRAAWEADFAKSKNNLEQMKALPALCGHVSPGSTGVTGCVGGPFGKLSLKKYDAAPTYSRAISRAFYVPRRWM
jgi:hypothetical protein